MDPEYHERIVKASYDELLERKAREGWTDVEFENDRDIVYAMFSGIRPGDRYLAKIDLARFPIDPYEVGFLDPEIDPSDRERVSDRDPRYWPYSPIPGLQGSFNLVRQGAITVFWCRQCTSAYFWYHGENDPWVPSEWPLHHVVEELRGAIQLAVHPRNWRPVERLTLLQIAHQNKILLPENAGIDHG